MQRVMIIGGPGSGKSTLARELGAATGPPVVHIDPMYWLPGWVPRPRPDVYAMIREAITADRWVFDGNSSDTLDDRLARADTVVFLDLPTWRRLWRITSRTLRYHGRTRPDMPPDCPERFDAEFFFWWTGCYVLRGSRKIARDFTERARQTHDVYHLRSPRDVEKFLAAARTESS